MPSGLKVFSDVFPLTQGIKLLKSAVLGTPVSLELSGILVLAAIAVVTYGIALKTFRWE
jgi:ABC-2 type transport system permease protein